MGRKKKVVDIRRLPPSERARVTKGNIEIKFSRLVLKSEIQVRPMGYIHHE